MQGSCFGSRPDVLYGRRPSNLLGQGCRNVQLWRNLSGLQEQLVDGYRRLDAAAALLDAAALARL